MTDQQFLSDINIARLQIIFLFDLIDGSFISQRDLPKSLTELNNMINISVRVRRADNRHRDSIILRHGRPANNDGWVTGRRCVNL